VQRHDSLLSDQVLGMSRKAGDSGQHSIDQVWAYEFAHCGQGCAHCSKKRRVSVI